MQGGAGFESFLHQWSDLWVLLTGSGTIALAIATFWVVRQSKQQRDDAERQHRERLKPICLLRPHDGIDAWNERAALIEATPPTPGNPGFGTVAIRCVLQNVGSGPALNLRLKFRFPDMNGWTTEPWELSPLAVGERYGGTTAPLIVPFRIQDTFNQTDFAVLPARPWEIWLEYEDIFGSGFETIHRKLRFDPDPSTFSWVPSVPGDQGKAVARPIPWFSYRSKCAGLPTRSEPSGNRSLNVSLHRSAQG